MKSRASAPGKIILFGEHFVVYGVKAILCAIDKRTNVTAEEIKEKKIYIKSEIGSLALGPGIPAAEINSPLKPLYYLADKTLQKNNSRTGIKITVESDIPPGVGLGSSSACCVAAAAAVSRLFSETMSKKEMLELAIRAEKTVFQDTSGADCTVCTYGGMMEYDKKHGFSKIDLKSDINLVIANSNMEHSTESIVSKVKRFREENGAEFSEMCLDESRLIENVLRLLQKNDLKRLGQKMVENQGYLKRIGISNETLQNMIKLGQKSSFGSKITGAGGGGCIISLTDESNQEQVIGQFKDKNYECFSVKIDLQGLILYN